MAGLCYVAYETEEVIAFLYKCIFSNNDIRIINRVIITDEDQTYKSVISRLIHCPKHILCALHKKKNFHKYLKSSELTREDKNQALDNFSTICFFKNKQTVEKCFNSLFLLKDLVFVMYCRKLYSEKESFSKAHINVFTLGYNKSSCAESMNRMIKINTEGRKISLLQFRMEFDQAHQRAFQNALYSDSKKQYPVNFPFTKIIPNVSKICVLEIYKNIQKSVKYSCSPLNNANTIFEVKHCKNLENTHVVEINETITCSCNQWVLFGYPCVHILNVLLNIQSNINCSNLIHIHWIVNNCTEINFDIDKFSFDCLKNTFNVSYNDNVTKELTLDINLQSPKRYCKILYLGKQLARIGSLCSEKMYDHIIENLSALISVQSLPVNATNEAIMAVPRKKGRKKLLKEPDTTQKESCKICRGQHKSQNCSIFNYYIWRIKNPSGDKKLRKCSLCNSHGHNYATCDVKIGGMLGINDEMIMNYYGKTQPQDINDLINNLNINEMI